MTHSIPWQQGYWARKRERECSPPEMSKDDMAHWENGWRESDAEEGDDE